MDEDKKKEQLTQQEVIKRARVMGVFLTRRTKFSFVFPLEKKEDEKKKIVDLFPSLKWKIYDCFSTKSKKHFRPQIRLRRLRKLGVGSASETDESGNQKSSKNDNNNSETTENVTAAEPSLPSTADKDDNKNVILTGQFLTGFSVFDRNWCCDFYSRTFTVTAIDNWGHW